MEKFESILENWINGNRKDVRKAVEKLSSNEQYNFANWLREKFKQEWHEKSDLFEMVLFLHFA